MSNPSPKPPNPEVYNLQKPEKLSTILQEDRDDCLSCRLVGQLKFPFIFSREWNVSLIHKSGASAFIGLGAYVFYSGREALKERGQNIAKQNGMGGVKWRLRGIALLSSSFVGMGLYRLVN